MKSPYNILFWMTLLFLIISNTFWVYQTIDNAVGQDYYIVSCNEYYQDMLQFKQILDSKKSQKEAIEFLDNNLIAYESFQKGNEFIIVFNSFALTYNDEGILISSDQN